MVLFPQNSSLTFTNFLSTMSCRGRCSPTGNTPPQRGPNNTSGNIPSPSHRTVHVAMERSPTRPEPMDGNYPECAGYGNVRIPPAARALAPGPYGYPSQFDTFGSQIDYNLSWMPKDINLSELLDQSGGQISSRLRRMEQNPNRPPPNVPPPAPEAVDPNANPLLRAEQEQANEPSPRGEMKKREESLMEWFDRSIEKELKKHKDTSLAKDFNFASPPPEILPDLNMSKGVLERLSGASASQMEICLDLRKEPDTDLTDAVDKYAKAEAMCAFAHAVKAAEAAADAAPPELVEEAALASARGYQTEVKTTNVHGELSGIRPIEVVGYIGVTKPKYPLKRT